MRMAEKIFPGKLNEGNEMAGEARAAGRTFPGVAFFQAVALFLSQWKLPHLAKCLLIPLSFALMATEAGAVTEIGGVATEGTLKIQVDDSGRIGVYRYTAGVWQNQIFGGSNKGSMLRINGSNYSLGYYSGNAVTMVSNTRVSDSQITAIWRVDSAAAGTLATITLNVTYQAGSSYLGLKWDIQNQSGGTLSDVRFFHGEDTYYYGSDYGAGFWDAPNNTIGVQKTIGDALRRMSLQAITPPYAYDSLYYYQVVTNISNGALTNTIDASETTDNGYALEWRKASFANSEQWTIQAYERFSDAPIGVVSVTAPTLTSCSQGATCNLTFTVRNLSTSSTSVALYPAVNQTGWSASLTSPTSPLTLAANESRQVVVAVTLPTAVINGTLASVTLTGIAGGTTASDIATVQASGTANLILSPSSINVTHDGITDSVTVTAPAGTIWSAVSNASWITVLSGASGSGNGTVVFAVAANTGTASRTGTLTIGGQTFTVTQDWGISQTGTSGADVLTAGDGNDALFGLDGNDTLSPGAGINIVYGGAGTDTLVTHSTSTSQVSIRAIIRDLIVVTDGTDTQVARGIEMVRVGSVDVSPEMDRAVGLDSTTWPPPLAQNLNLPLLQIYVAGFGRAPALSGYEYWLNEVNSKGIQAVADTIFSLDIVKTIFPDSLSNEAFVETIFINVFGRPAASSGLAYWSSQMAAGSSRGKLVLDMTTAALNTPDGSSGKAYFDNRVDVSGYAVFKQWLQSYSRSVSELTELLRNVDGGGAGLVAALGTVDAW